MPAAEVVSKSAAAVVSQQPADEYQFVPKHWKQSNFLVYN